jgi:hypothetical protein
MKLDAVKAEAWLQKRRPQEPQNGLTYVESIGERTEAFEFGPAVMLRSHRGRSSGNFAVMELGDSGWRQSRQQFLRHLET